MASMRLSELANVEEVSKEEADELLTSISKAEVEAAAKSLSLQKAAHPDHIQAEHL